MGYRADVPPFFEYLSPGSGDGPEKMRVLLHPERPLWLVGNGTMSETARLLAAGKSCAEVGAAMAGRFNIDPESAARDARHVADRLKAHGFLDEEEHTPCRTPRLKSLFVYVTGRCNLACAHCYYTGTPGGDLDPGLYRKMVDEFVEMGGTDIVLTGGEALLHSDLRDLLAYGARHCAVSLLTNGTLLDKEWASFLAGLKDVHIQVSIDGSRKEIHDAIRGEGAFENALRGIACLQEAGLGPRINLCGTIMAHNLSDLPGIVDLAARLGVPRVRFVPVRKGGRAGDGWDIVGAPVDGSAYGAFFDKILDLKETNGAGVNVSCGLSGFVLTSSDGFSDGGFWCPVGTKLVVNQRGDAHPCVLMREEEFSLGNVFREGLARVMASEKMAHACAALGERKDRIGECARCVWRSICQAGCMGEALEREGTVWGKGRFCEYRRSLYEKAFTKLLSGASSSSQNKGQ